ncbi:NACHT and WD domain protein [Colletotrichum scovillei]|uniref:NACHT and WD domain protein n=1 Tax=Colletotrichum scovillei TaxID=1209932 RepID=UPI0015C33196|nr:NACHT and WD domain protein [Colletotrichum scovillei]KAF4775434.1 NACHT and WD domain protein [Colletotrichum scovillei]
MLLCGIIEELEQSDPRPLCYFFCQATVPALDNATSVLRSLVLQLAQKYPWLRNQVLAVYEKGGKARFNDHNAWGTMYELLNSMLSDPQLDGVLLIVDALDECTTDRPKLLQFIKNLSTISRAKVIISSRKWTEIGEMLGEDDTNGSTITLELHDDLISKAVHSYINREVQQLASRKRFNEITCSEIRLYLRKQSQDTFLWVSLVCQALLDGSVKKRNVMKVLETFPPGLDAFYERMISSLPSLDEDLYKEILSVMSILKRPVTIEELLPLLQSHFSNDTESLEEAIESCGSFLKIQAERIYFVHQSAVEFLKSSASNLPTVVERHKSVFQRSMDVLNRPGHLKRDIYGLKEPGTGIAEIHTPEPDPLCALQYFCTYWVDHLTDWVCEQRVAMGKPTPQENSVISEVDTFLRGKFLNWIEALSLLRQMQQAIQAIQKLQGLPNSIEQGLSAFIHDANRFLLYHKVMIENAPLQLYASALLFSPDQSVVKVQFRDEAPDWVTITPGLETRWSACLQTLDYNVEREYGACCVAYSSDGEWLVTRYVDGTVKLWHAKSGTCTHTVHIGIHGEEDEQHSGSKGSKLVAFSADGKSVVSSSWNGFVKVWDRDTGRCTHQLEPHSRRATATAISSDGYTVASAFWNYIIIQSTKGEFPARTVERHPGRGEAHSIALSADGRWIALGSINHLIEIFDVSTGDGQQISTDDRIFTVAWSPDGAWVASGGLRGICSIVRIWERQTGKIIRRFKYEIPSKPGYGDYPNYMDFSADKRFLAAGSRYDICVWNTSTGALTWAMYGSNTRNINSISFSPDAQRIVSASYPSTIDVWDLSITADSIPHWPIPGMEQLIFADNDRFLAHDLRMDKIRLWDRRADMPESTEVIPGVDGSSIIWLRDAREPVRMYFTE